MKAYEIVMSTAAELDIDELYNFIAIEYKSLLTAKRYSRGLRNTIKSLKRLAESFQIQTQQSLQKYEHNVRRANYKKMAVIYTVHDDVVLIRRIIPSAMITNSLNL